MLNQSSFTPQRQQLMIYIILAAVTAAVYWQVHHFEFINLDDNFYVTENIHVLSGFTKEGFLWAFITKDTGLWNPLIILSFVLDYELYGLNAGGYHITNLILHIFSSLLLFWFFHRMTNEIWKSAFVAAFFALHPLHVESVAWVSERKDVLSAFFWMLTLCFYVYYTEKPVIQRYLLVLFSFVLALLSKPMVVTLPVIMILLDYWPLNRFQLKKDNWVLWQLKEKWPFFILSTMLVIITYYTPGNSVSHTLLPLEVRLANAPVSFVIYLIKTFWPHNMAIFYPFPDHIPGWQVFGASMMILVISITVIVTAKRLPYLLVGWLWYVITIAPVIGVIQIWVYAMADRYHYLPSVGIAVMLAWGVPSFINNKYIRKIILVAVAIAFLALMSLLTWRQCGYWKNSTILFSHALHIKKNDVAYIHLGLSLFAEGKFEEAIDNYDKAIGVKSGYADVYAYNNKGAAYAALNQYQLAIENFNKGIALNPYDFKAYNNRGVVYSELRQYQLAMNDFNEAIRLAPTYANAYANRALIYLSTGDIIRGCSNVQKACKLGNCRTLNLARGKGICN